MSTNNAPESAVTSAEVDRDWRYFSEALSWYPPNLGLTGAQTFGVVQQIISALRFGRISPEDLGIEMHGGVRAALWHQVAETLAAELARWGWGDMHYGPQGQDEAVVRALHAYEEAKAVDG